MKVVRLNREWKRKVSKFEERRKGVWETEPLR